MTIQHLPHEIQDLPELFQRMYEAAPAEIVPLEWVARQAGYKNVGSIHCQCALQRDPPCARKSDPPLGVMCKDTKWGFNEGGKRGVA